MNTYKFVFLFLLFCSQTATGQNVTLYEQLNGRYDFTFIGNTMNSAENNVSNFYVTGTTSSTTLNLESDETVIRAYLYWAGSGDGDFDVTLNENAITPERTFSYTRTFTIPPYSLSYFSAFKDITSYVQTTGNGTYTLADLDISPYESDHFMRKTNFAGWAIIIVYEKPTLPLNQLNIYDGLQSVPNTLTINLTNLNVLDNNNATAGFLAWEGDVDLPTEHFYINGQELSNNLNPVNNVFNGTNSILGVGSSQYYNMDLDIYAIEDYIQVGNTNATIELTSTQDVILMNTVVTKINSQLPDATVTLENFTTSCNTNAVTIDYTVYNVNSTDVLPANTQIGFYIASDLVGSTTTQNDIAIGDNESGTIVINLPVNTPESFILTAFVDNTNLVFELNEDNNKSNDLSITQLLPPTPLTFNNISNCNLGFTSSYFDFSNYAENDTYTISFFETYEDANNNTNPISNSSNYFASQTPFQIFVRIKNDTSCYSITSFYLNTTNCLPNIHNVVSVNNDGVNDAFFIDGLRDVFVNFKLEIYNRWGKLVWTGNNNTADWNGTTENGLFTNKTSTGTYFYILYLNDPAYPDALLGYLYVIN
ncbi:gliding motility-associated C-terminal domain-containing protein [Flavobacterium sp.]|uniref:T9SS type B sorting domain-containing protein n=1 Tax=Flavobacterium sp. TaxID=239 RepID=UPI003527557B